MSWFRSLLLVGILTAVGIGLFASKSSYTTRLAQQTLQSAALLAQQRALASAESLGDVNLMITQSSADWTFKLVQNGVMLDTLSAERDGDQLSIAGTVLSDGATYSLPFDSQGMTGSQSRQVIFSGESTHKLCISAMGLAYPGDCQP